MVNYAADMKIGLIADTHISQPGEKLPPQVRRVFDGVDLILHAGDIYLLSVLDELEEIAPVLAARGNGDMRLPPDPRLDNCHLLEIEGLSIGLTHGIDYPEPPWGTLEATMQREFGCSVNIIVFGDTHMELVETYKGVLLVNPGSPTLPHGLIKLGTVGLLEICRSQAKARIVQLG